LFIPWFKSQGNLGSQGTYNLEKIEIWKVIKPEEYPYPHFEPPHGKTEFDLLRLKFSNSAKQLFDKG